MNIIHLVSNKVWGGGERYALDLCKRLAADGFDVTVFSRGRDCVDSHFAEAGIPLRRLPLGGLPDFISPLKLANFLRDKSGDATIIHVHNFKDAVTAVRARRLAGKGTRIGIVCTRHLVKRGGTSARWRRLYGAIDRIVFVSELARKEFLESRPDVDNEKLTVIHNGVAVPERYSVPSFRSSSGDAARILFTGRIAPEKGLDILIEALASMKDVAFRLVVAGEGKEEYVKELHGMARNTGLENRIEWKGFVGDVFQEIACSDICVVPTTARESFGLAVVEAMSQGKPVVTTSNGAQTEIITNGTDGLLVAPSAPAELAAGIRRLAADPALREAMGKKAYATFSSRFSHDVFYGRMKRLYESLSR